MKERYDAEKVLREVLEVLRRHHIPAETVSLDVSLLDANFDEHIPQLKTYKAGHFHKPMDIDGVPVLFHAQRRYPFDEIVHVLEHEIRPPVEAFAATVKQENPDLKIEFIQTSASQSKVWPHSLDLRIYGLDINCQFSDDAHADYNQLKLGIWLHQREATAYPRLHATVGWLVDEESGGDWGLDIVYNAIATGLDYSPHQVGMLRNALPSYFTRFRTEIVRTLAGQSPDTPLVRDRSSEETT